MNIFNKLWTWPTIAFLSWISDWLFFTILKSLKIDIILSIFITFLFVLIKTFKMELTKWQKVFLCLGFPISFILLFYDKDFSQYIWLASLLVLLFVYPPSSWKDAPIFPTHRNALNGLQEILNVKSNDKILDFGSGLGHGIRAIKNEFPSKYIFGIEKSFFLLLFSKIIFPKETFIHDDMWSFNLSNFNILYVFQRPETMEKIWCKACAEMPPNSYVISLEFPILSQKEIFSKKTYDDKTIYVYKTYKN